MFLLESYFVSFFSTWRTRRNKCKGIQSSAKCQRREWGVECARGVSLPRPVTTAKQILYSQGIFSLSLCRLLYPATPHPPSKMYRFGIVCQQQDTRRYVTLRCVTGSEMRWMRFSSKLVYIILYLRIRLDDVITPCRLCVFAPIELLLGL